MGKVSLVEKEWLGAETIFEDDDDDDATATTAALTDVSEPLSDNESDLEDDEDFAAENLPRDPPAKLLYGGEGETPLCALTAGGDVAAPKGGKIRPGRSTDDVPEVNPKRQCLYAKTLPEVNSEGQWPASANVDVPEVNSDRQCLCALNNCVHRATSVHPAKDTRANAQGDATKQEPRHWTRLGGKPTSDDDIVAARRRLAEEIMGEAATQPMKIRGLMAPRWRANAHPAAPMLREYARRGCPVDVGPDWTLEQLEAAVARGPHTSALKPDAIEQIQVEARDKAAQGFATIYKWDELRKNLPRLLKLSPLAMIPHKSRKYRAILDLSFALQVAGYDLPSVNEATKDTAPEEAIEQIGTVLPRLIEAFANAPPGEALRLMKLDITDGFWRMVCAEGEEWNFAYVLPNHPGQPVEIVVPSALQMGWALSPPFFCAASETARDVAQTYVQEALGTLPPHPLEDMTMPKDAEFVLPDMTKVSGRAGAKFLQMLEVYVDDFLQMVQSNDEEVLRHCSRALLHAIHSVFPPPAITGHNGAEPVSIKKLLQGEGLWEVRKELLGWVFDGATRCIELATKKQEAILKELKNVLRMKRGVPFKRIEKLVGKLRHAAIGIPGGKGLFGPINQMMQFRPRYVRWKTWRAARQAFDDWRQLIRAAAKEPTHTKELVPDEADYVGALDASGEGAGGVWIPGKTELAPIVWRFEWPPEVVTRLVTEDNPEGDITNSDLEMAAEVLGWLVLEGCVPVLRWKHVGVWSDNTPTVAWTTRWASRRSAAANRLLRILAIRHREKRASPLVARHLAGELNTLGDIPSRSFGYKAEWHFVEDDAFLTFFNQKFPLPLKNSWQGFRLTSAVATKVTNELLTEASSMAEWRRLAKLGRRYGRSGRSIATTSACLPTSRASTSNASPESPRRSEEGSARAREGGLSALGTFAPASGTSTRRSPWTQGASPSTNKTESTT